MLAARHEHRSLGIGRALVDFAEQASARKGLTTMRLELLVPVGWTHPSKEVLDVDRADDLLVLGRDRDLSRRDRRGQLGGRRALKAVLPEVSSAAR